MNLLRSLPILAALSAAPLALPAETTPVISPVITPVTTPSAELAFMSASPLARSHAAWNTVISLDAKGLPLRAVLAAMFESAKVAYAVDPTLDATIYASVKDVTLRDAVGILGRLAEFDVRAENGVWYASRKRSKSPNALSAPSFAPLTGGFATIPATRIAAKPPKTTVVRNTGRPQTSSSTGRTTVATQTILIDATPQSGALVPMRVAPATTVRSMMIRTTFPIGATETDLPIAPRKPKVAKTPSQKVSGKPALNRRVTTKLPKAPLREVFDSFSQQTGVPIVVDASVPRYRIDAYMNGCSLKYALDKICAAAGLSYRARGAAIEIVAKS